MINAGAIATTSLISAEGGTPLDRIMAMFGRYTGRDLEIDDDVHRSENETGHRNRAIVHMLRNFDVVSEEPERGLDVYFRQCSVAVNCRDLAVMAATLANRGVNPVTAVRALDAEYVDRVLAVMGSCGMYDFAGEWIYRIGMPANSGVSGGILACLPGQLGIGVYSPRLDLRGNSVRGERVCSDLSNVYSLHLHNVPNVTRACIRSRYSSTDVRSKRQRTAAEANALTEHGERVRIYELQGHLNFASVEMLSRQVVDDAPETDFFALDFKRTLHLDLGGIELLDDLLSNLLASGKLLAVSDSEHVRGLGQRIEALARTSPSLYLADNLDAPRGVRPDDARDLALLAGRRAPGVRGRGLPLPADDPRVQPGADRVPAPEGVDRERRTEDGRGRRAVGDGLRPHGFMTEKYLRETLLTAVAKGAARTGRSLDDIGISVGGFNAFGETQSDVEQALDSLRRPISFYGSTRTYHGVFRAHGLESLGMQLYELSLRGEWDKMLDAVTFEHVVEMANACTYDELPKFAREHFEYANRISFPLGHSEHGASRYGGSAEGEAVAPGLTTERLNWLISEFHNL